ncbi:hypothetical protein DY000_02029495 [Brassica cretica]|uniref:Uncharacterized protein n=1 Tax=Brassica cretica TaxID=69181 RepID=A0ABQ7DF40_BRACR|nr:hypothetical protein DY000_02029495 [Brassica cretica]
MTSASRSHQSRSRSRLQQLAFPDQPRATQHRLRPDRKQPARVRSSSLSSSRFSLGGPVLQSTNLR